MPRWGAGGGKRGEDASLMAKITKLLEVGVKLHPHPSVPLPQILPAGWLGGGRDWQGGRVIQGRGIRRKFPRATLICQLIPSKFAIYRLHPAARIPAPASSAKVRGPRGAGRPVSTASRDRFGFVSALTPRAARSRTRGAAPKPPPRSS